MSLAQRQKPQIDDSVLYFSRASSTAEILGRQPAPNCLPSVITSHRSSLLRGTGIIGLIYALPPITSFRCASSSCSFSSPLLRPSGYICIAGLVDDNRRVMRCHAMPPRLRAAALPRPTFHAGCPKDYKKNRQCLLGAGIGQHSAAGIYTLPSPTAPSPACHWPQSRLLPLRRVCFTSHWCQFHYPQPSTATRQSDPDEPPDKKKPVKCGCD